MHRDNFLQEPSNTALVSYLPVSSINNMNVSPLHSIQWKHSLTSPHLSSPRFHWPNGEIEHSLYLAISVETVIRIGAILSPGITSLPILPLALLVLSFQIPFLILEGRRYARYPFRMGCKDRTTAWKNNSQVVDWQGYGSEYRLRLSTGNILDPFLNVRFDFWPFHSSLSQHLKSSVLGMGPSVRDHS